MRVLPLTLQSPAQLVECAPPGRGGVERVAHTLASHFDQPVYTFQKPDSYPVAYSIRFLPSIRLFRIFLPLPSLQFFALLNERSLHIHLPSISGLLVALVYKLYRLFRPYTLTIHWHAFIFHPLSGRFTFKTRLGLLYQALALFFVKHSTAVITTSPSLLHELHKLGVKPDSSFVLPPSISASAEDFLLSNPIPCRDTSTPFRFIFIGRLSSYKRPDWLIRSLATIDKHKWTLDVVGEGPKLSRLQNISKGLPVTYHTDLTDPEKHTLLSQSHALLLLSDSSSEAFGIVQLESMCAGLPTFSLRIPLSGAYEVSKIPEFDWSGELLALPNLLNRLISLSPTCYFELALLYRDAYQTRYSNCINSNFIKRIWSVSP